MKLGDKLSILEHIKKDWAAFEGNPEEGGDGLRRRHYFSRVECIWEVARGEDEKTARKSRQYFG